MYHHKALLCTCTVYCTLTLKFVMRLGVRLTTALLGEWFPADPTFERPLARVYSFVPGQILFGVEGLVARPAGVAAHTAVIGLVGLVFYVVRELFPAKLAKDSLGIRITGPSSSSSIAAGFRRGTWERGPSFAAPCTASCTRAASSFGTV